MNPLVTIVNFDKALLNDKVLTETMLRKMKYCSIIQPDQTFSFKNTLNSCHLVLIDSGFNNIDVQLISNGN